MPLDARSVTMAESPPTLSPEAKAQVHHAAIDAMLSKPWSEWELEDSDNGGDHDRMTAGRYYTPNPYIDQDTKAALVKVYEGAGWRVLTAYADPRLLIAPKARIVKA